MTLETVILNEFTVLDLKFQTFRFQISEMLTLEFNSAKMTLSQ